MYKTLKLCHIFYIKYVCLDVIHIHVTKRAGLDYLDEFYFLKNMNVSPP